MSDRHQSDEQLVHQLSGSIDGLTCAINKLAGEAHGRDSRLLESSLWRVHQLARRLKRLAKAIGRLDDSTER